MQQAAGSTPHCFIAIVATDLFPADLEEVLFGVFLLWAAIGNLCILSDPDFLNADPMASRLAQ